VPSGSYKFWSRPIAKAIRPLACCSLLFLLGEPPTTAHAGKPKAKDEETEPSKQRPRLGMTRAQVRKRYGEPDNIHVTSRGETWFYFFNRGHYFIPYYFGAPRTATFYFNGAGFLTDFEYNQEN
jgi:hypothetical protein